MFGPKLSTKDNLLNMLSNFRYETELNNTLSTQIYTKTI